MKAVAALNRKPRICFVIPSLNGGGAERVLTSLANDFYNLQYQSVVVSLNSCVPAYSINENLKVYYLTDRRKDDVLSRLYYMFQTFFKLLFIIGKEKPVSAISFITSANLWTGIICSITNTPYTVSERTSPHRSIGLLNAVSKKLAAIVYKRAVAVIVGSEAGGVSLKRNKGFAKLDNIQVIPNAVSQFNRPSLKSIHHRKFILAVGRLAYVKGFDQLIAAFYAAKLCDIDLLIIGEGQERTRLTSQIETLGLTARVFMPGSRSNLEDYYSQAELFVLPSRNEGYPNVLVEAMSFGCACIAMDCDFGPAEIIQNEHNGLLVEKDNTAALTDTIIRLNNDPVLKNKIGDNARHINRTNNHQSILKKWQQLVLAPKPD